LEAEELFFFLPIVEGADWGHDKYTHEDGETLNPGYLIVEFNKIFFKLKIE
jgi:hypothetical protein